eukprot:GHVS01067615.1.p1 GENE.GHVS01067615.1~~GHVS01067615.1.p1  ORF type:complete len:541 (-),score=53.77 GHVS01067615.1:1616-3214(-)
MDLHDDFHTASLWVETEFSKFDSCNGPQSFFEITIRVLGGLLSAYSLSGRAELLPVIRDIGQRYLDVFSNTSIPPQKIDLCARRGWWDRFQPWVPIAEVASCQLEFRMLTFVTGDERFMQISNHITLEVLYASSLQEQGFRYLPRSHVALSGANKYSIGEKLSLGAYMDSYVEYLLKLWLLTDQQEVYWKALWHGAADEILTQLVDTTAGPGRHTFVNTALNYKKGHVVNRLGADSSTHRKTLEEARKPISWKLAEFHKKRRANQERTRAAAATNQRTSRVASVDNSKRLREVAQEDRARLMPHEIEELDQILQESISRRKGGHRPRNNMEHLACFTGGMFMLAAKKFPPDVRDEADVWTFTAEAITNTCMQMYSNSRTGLGAEATRFHMSVGSEEEMYVEKDTSHYLLRPELVESLYYMHYYTGDPKYREFGYKVFQAILKHCKTEAGFASIKDVRANPVTLIDKMESFWHAETLKYLFLLFMHPGTLDLRDWVFNTEGHPFPVLKGGLPAELLLKAAPKSTLLNVTQPYV